MSPSVRHMLHRSDPKIQINDFFFQPKLQNKFEACVTVGLNVCL